MKKIMMFLLAVVALSACEQTASEIIPEPSTKALTNKGRQVTVNTEVKTKTAIAPKQNGGYSFSWQQDDAIRLFEVVYENYGSTEDNATASDYFFSAGLQNDASSATFTVDLNTTLTAPEGAKYRYVAAYPSEYPDFYYYWSSDDSYSEVWPDSECSFNHLVLYTEFPYQQCPLSTSFDPRADLMVSSQKILDTRAEGDILLSFARIGAIVKVHLTGLAAGEKVETGYVLFGDSFKVNTTVEYDVELGDVRYIPMDPYLVGKEAWDSNYRFGFYSSSAVEINPDNLYVDENGNVDIWLRLPEGEVTDSFSIKVWTRPYENQIPGDWHSFGKSVDLASLNRSLTFENGRMTSFSVATEVMEDPYLRLSCTYTDAYGNELNAITDNGSISVGKYGAYLSPTGGKVVLDVETNADPSDIVINNYCSWADASFDPETMKLTLTYNPCSEYANYMVSDREAYLYVELSSFAAASVQIVVNQLKPYFADSGTRKSILTWHGGSVTGLIRCNSEPVIECPDDTEHLVVNWVSEKTDTGYNVTFTLSPNETASLSALTAYVRDPISPETKYVRVNLLRYPMIADGSYYILTQNTHNGTPYHWYGLGADLSSDDVTVFPCDIAFDAESALDFDSTDYLIPFTFTRIEGEDEYRITCKRGDITYYLSFGGYRQTGQYYITLNPHAPLTLDNKDASKWDVVSLGSEIAIRNHVYAETSETAPYLIHYSLDYPSSVYLRTASSIEITDNQGSYGTTYFCRATTWAESWNAQTELPCNVRLYDISTGTYYPQSY